MMNIDTIAAIFRAEMVSAAEEGVRRALSSPEVIARLAAATAASLEQATAPAQPAPRAPVTRIKRIKSTLPSGREDRKERRRLALRILHEQRAGEGLHRDDWMELFFAADADARDTYGKNYRGKAKSGEAAARAMFFRMIDAMLDRHKVIAPVAGRPYVYQLAPGVAKAHGFT